MRGNKKHSHDFPSTLPTSPSNPTVVAFMAAMPLNRPIHRPRPANHLDVIGGVDRISHARAGIAWWFHRFMRYTLDKAGG